MIIVDSDVWLNQRIQNAWCFHCQQWLRERATVLRYNFIACLVFITFVPGIFSIFSYMPERIYICMVCSVCGCSVAAVYGTGNAVFFFMKNTFYIYLVLSELCSQCPIWLFSVLCCCTFPVCCWGYFVNDFGMVPSARIITGITSVFTLHMHCTSVVRSIYFITFSGSYFLSHFLSRIVMSGPGIA
jgi:hypothetical protein